MLTKRFFGLNLKDILVFATKIEQPNMKGSKTFESRKFVRYRGTVESRNFEVLGTRVFISNYQ